MTAWPTQLRELLNGPALVAPGVFDGISAALARRAGAKAVYVSGAGSAAARGLPDMSVMSANELVDATRVIVASSELPAIVDVDSGYGGNLNLRRLLADLARVGAAAVQIEDQAFPRVCGYLTRDVPIPTEQMLHRLEAARASAEGMLVVARTDALLTAGVDEAIRRAIRFRDAGADLVMVNGIRDLGELERVSREVNAAQVYNMSGSDRSPFVAPTIATELGITIIVYPIQVHRAAALAAETMLTALVAGTPPDPAAMTPFTDFMGLAGWDEAARFDQQFRESPGGNT